MSASAEQMGGSEANIEIWQLADGAEVPAPVVRSAMVVLEVLLGRYEAVAAHDLVGLSEGRQPDVTPWHGDLRPTYADIGVARAREDGSLAIHTSVADVVRNAPHINPQDAFEFRLVDPRETFAGFESQHP